MAEAIHSRRWWIVLTVLIAVVLCPLALGKTIYVDDDAPAPGGGSSWASAYKYLQDALTAAELMEKPIEIHVAQGTYWPDRGSKYPSGTPTERQSFI